MVLESSLMQQYNRIFQQSFSRKMKGVISCTFDGCLHVSTWDGKLSSNAGVDAYLGKI